MPIELVPLLQESKTEMAMEVVLGLLATSMVASGAVMAEKSSSARVSSFGEIGDEFKRE